MALRVCAYQTDYKKWRLYRAMLATDPEAAVLMREQIVKGYFEANQASAWQNREYVSKEFMLACPNIRTVAQFLAAYCQREIDVKCEDLADLVQCLRLIGSRGHFDDAKAIQAFKRNNLYRYDSGKELFQYCLAWHGPNTHAVYIAMPKDAHFFNKARTHYSAQPMGIREFNSRMSDLGDATGADESSRDRDYPIERKWTIEKIHSQQIVKQPDVLLAMFLMRERFSAHEKTQNYRFYEQRCVHTSSLSPSIHSIVACDVGRYNQAYDYYLWSSRLDLDNFNNNTEEPPGKHGHYPRACRTPLQRGRKRGTHAREKRQLRRHDPNADAPKRAARDRGLP